MDAGEAFLTAKNGQNIKNSRRRNTAGQRSAQRLCNLAKFDLLGLGKGARRRFQNGDLPAIGPGSPGPPGGIGGGGQCTGKPRQSRSGLIIEQCFGLGINFQRPNYGKKTA